MSWPIDLELSLIHAGLLPHKKIAQFLPGFQDLVWLYKVIKFITNR